MQFYFSGLNDQRTVQLLLAAGVSRVLVDQFDVEQSTPFPSVILDSGAYRAWKQDLILDLDAYIDLALSRSWARVVALDVFGDAQASYDNWLKMRQIDALADRLIPVWPWGSDEAILREYLDHAQVVGLGGLVPLLRRRKAHEDPPPDWKEQRERTLADLVDLAARYPGRFHAFGLCWAKATDVLWDLLASADTSHWLARRNGYVLNVNTQWGYLQETPFRVLGYEPEQACLESAKALLTFQTATWRCEGCGRKVLHRHHRLRLLPASKRKCPGCGGKVKAHSHEGD